MRVGTQYADRTVNWHFKSEDAREKLKSLYPQFDRYGWCELPYLSNRQNTSYLKKYLIVMVRNTSVGHFYAPNLA